MAGLDQPRDFTDAPIRQTRRTQVVENEQPDPSWVIRRQLRCCHSRRIEPRSLRLKVRRLGDESRVAKRQTVGQ